MKLPWRPLAQQQKNGTTIASNSTLTRTIQFGLYSCISACQLVVVDDTCFSSWNSMLPLHLCPTSVFHGSDVSCRYSLGYESILRANYRNPLCSDEHSQSTDLEHVVVSQENAEDICERPIPTHCRPRFADCSKADMRRLQILVTDSILLTFLTRSTSPLYPLDDLWTWN